ncbi:SDR family NAD(P)-dependent oxidoreductase [Sphingopyxis sp. R3-92]|uniref:SDR family NAD(P)-dependent oxidoreductase n=1 Tax=Sphingopyxis sp. R3-92 TaxID=3158553 RepID=UPI003EE5CC36
MTSQSFPPVEGRGDAVGNHYDFEGRVAVVTGGAQGIGFGVAQRIVAGGGAVALWDRDGKMLDDAGARLGDNARALRQRVDIGDLGAVEVAAQQAVEHFGRIDILINNAALVGPNVPTWEYPPDAFRDVVHVGLTGAFYCCRAVVPHMIQKGYGRIVNVSSIAGKEGNPNAVAYSSAKAGLLALTKSLGKELAGHDIAVNAVTPAFAKTALAMTQSPQHIEYILSKIPRGRMLDIAEATSMICWLATEENSFTTAAVFDLSGGRATY